MHISLLNPVSLYSPESVLDKEVENKGKSFSQIMKDQINKTNQLQKEADKVTNRFMAGDQVELHDVMLAMEKADLALQVTMQVRNKVIQAYKEISQMQI